MSEIPPQQLVLDVQLSAYSKLDNFICAPENQSLILLLKQFFEPAATNSIATQARHIYLYGASATGKTHLLHGLCDLAHKRGMQCIYLPLKELVDMSPDAVLCNLESAQFICLDDVQAVKHSERWQRELFHFYNRIQACGHHLFIAANNVPDALGFGLKDLVSRLKWGLVFRVAPLDEQGLRELLKIHALQRGIRLDSDVLEYIMLRAQRDTQTLISIIEKLDLASWQNGRAITRPFVKDVLSW